MGVDEGIDVGTPQERLAILEEKVLLLTIDMLEMFTPAEIIEAFYLRVYHLKKVIQESESKPESERNLPPEIPFK